MTDPLKELTAIADRVERGAADGSLVSERAVQLRAAEPLVELLGWDVRGDDVHPEATVGGQTVDYLLTIENESTVAVATTPPERDVEQAADDVLRPLLEDAHAPRGIVTDGRQVVLLARTNGAVYDHAFPFADLTDHAGALGRFHRSSLEEWAADERTQRRDAAQRLAAERETVAHAITENVLSVTGTEAAETVSTAVDRLVEDLVDAIAPDEAEIAGNGRSDASMQPDRSESSPEADGSDSGGGADRSGAASSRTDPDAAASTADADAVSGSKPNEPASERATGSTEIDQAATRGSGDAAESGGSYVARFFGGSSSVGAVGTASPRSTTVGVVRYLLENQQLHRAVTFPWEVEAGTPIVADSGPAPEWIALENPDAPDVYVRPVDDPVVAKAAIEGLAEAVGLRVMFQGDW